jgi:NAD(P)-dependent dehydrogenase (short-subunit alcohol dehydrogenase family)
VKHFQGRVAVITGAASGIGRAIAERCARSGMRVVLADMDEVALSEAEAALTGQDATVLSVKTDVSKRSDVEDLARRAFDTFDQVHLLFNNAGVAAGGAAWEATSSTRPQAQGLSSAISPRPTR